MHGVEETCAELKPPGLLHMERHEGPAIEGGKRSERGVEERVWGLHLLPITQ
jgi:hypothetical protein